jgi:hypothetical protein
MRESCLQTGGSREATISCQKIDWACRLFSFSIFNLHFSCRVGGWDPIKEKKKEKKENTMVGVIHSSIDQCVPSAMPSRPWELIFNWAGLAFIDCRHFIFSLPNPPRSVIITRNKNWSAR